MIVERLDLPAARALPLRAVLRRAWDWWWWSVRTHVADRHLLPRPDPPPADWSEPSPPRGCDLSSRTYR
jgi:hypothetical protein